MQKQESYVVSVPVVMKIQVKADDADQAKQCADDFCSWLHGLGHLLIEDSAGELVIDPPSNTSAMQIEDNPALHHVRKGRLKKKPAGKEEKALRWWAPQLRSRIKTA